MVKFQECKTISNKLFDHKRFKNRKKIIIPKGCTKLAQILDDWHSISMKQVQTTLKIITKKSG